MSGDRYRRRPVDAQLWRLHTEYVCGCRWVRVSGHGDVLLECSRHSTATAARVDCYERVRRYAD